MKHYILLLFLAGIVTITVCLLDSASIFIGLWQPVPVRPPIRDAEPSTPLLSDFRDCICTISSGEKARYVLYVPPDYDPSQRCPLIVFLHGYGKRGTDGRMQLLDGLSPAIRHWSGWQEHGHFLVLFPQGRSGNWLPKSIDDDLVMSELADVQIHYSVDAARIYLTGISSGGTGVWNLAIAYPDQWAAIVPVCGMCNPEDAAHVCHIPCWCFHGGEDKNPSPVNPREVMRRLRAEGATPRYTEYPGMRHDIWNKVYRSPELYQWLRQQHRE